MGGEEIKKLEAALEWARTIHLQGHFPMEIKILARGLRETLDEVDRLNKVVTAAKKRRPFHASAGAVEEGERQWKSALKKYHETPNP